MNFLKRLFRKRPHKIGVSVEVVDKFTPAVNRVADLIEKSITDQKSNESFEDYLRSKYPHAKIERFGDEIHITEQIQLPVFSATIAVQNVTHEANPDGSCKQWCGVNYCDENGCTHRKRVPVGPPYSDDCPPSQPIV